MLLTHSGAGPQLNLLFIGRTWLALSYIESRREETGNGSFELFTDFSQLVATIGRHEGWDDASSDQFGGY
jgi:hypothetical protein